MNQQHPTGCYSTSSAFVVVALSEKLSSYICLCRVVFGAAVYRHIGRDMVYAVTLAKVYQEKQCSRSNDQCSDVFEMHERSMQRRSYSKEVAFTELSQARVNGGKLWHCRIGCEACDVVQRR
jgi:hypothetical protein